MFSLFLVISIALLPLHAFKLHHRLHHPSLPQPDFQQRAQILLDSAGNPRIDPLQAHFDAQAGKDALYQLALDTGTSDSLWLISSVKAVYSFLLFYLQIPSPSFTQCHLVSSANEHLILHLPYPGGTPFAFEYFLDSTPSDGTCPPIQASGPTLALPQNITITTTIPKRPPLFVLSPLSSPAHFSSFYRPELRVPPPLTETGDPVVRAPEKTFVQKYWLYIIIALGALSASGLLVSLDHPSSSTCISNYSCWRRRSARIMMYSYRCSIESCFFRGAHNANSFALRGHGSSVCHPFTLVMFSSSPRMCDIISPVYFRASPHYVVLLHCATTEQGPVTVTCRCHNPSSMPFTIRPATLEDTPALSCICLLTGDAGQSAEHLHKHPELLGLLWALSYVSLPPEAAHTWGFVLVDDTAPDNDHTTNAIKGYILGTSDTRAYEAAAEEGWWPALRIRFPLSSDADERMTADQEYIDLIHRAPDAALDACLAVSPAHMHINLLPEVQRRGWGRTLIGRAVDHLRERQIGAVWLGVAESNVGARRFYERIGFREIQGAPEKLMALDIETWKGRVEASTST